MRAPLLCATTFVDHWAVAFTPISGLRRQERCLSPFPPSPSAMATAAFVGLVSLPLRPRGRAGGGCRSGRRPPAAPLSSSPAPAVVIVAAATGGDDKDRALPAAKGFGAPTPGGPGSRGRGGGGADARRADASAAGASAGAAGGGDGTLGFVGADTMGIVFTCGVCDTRISKSISRSSYERGVVLIQCPGCEKCVASSPPPSPIRYRPDVALLFVFFCFFSCVRGWARPSCRLGCREALARDSVPGQTTPLTSRPSVDGTAARVGLFLCWRPLV